MILEMVGTKYTSFMGRPHLWGILSNEISNPKIRKLEKHNNKTYGSTCLTSLQPNDVCIRDLG